MGGLLVLSIAWLIIGGLVGAFAGKVTKSEPPFGLTVDILTSIVTEVIIGAAACSSAPSLASMGSLGSSSALSATPSSPP